MRELDAGTVVGYLRERGVVPVREDTVAGELHGGVSATVLLVESGDQRWVVKRSLPRLRVAAEWLAKPERALTEAAALRVLGAVTPDRTPAVVDVDAGTCTITMTAAPKDWVSWRDTLLHGSPDEADVGTAGALGDVLGRWHATSWADAGLARRFDDYEALEALRVAPFHRVVGGRHPEVSGVVDRCIDDLLRRRECLVHGDFSPKNVLVGESGLWVLDPEVAHFGAAVFDVAFLQCHLLLKALHRPPDGALLRRCGDAFLESYARALGRPPSLTGLGAHTACLLLARVDGSSPAGYLDHPTRSRARAVALRALQAQEPDLAMLWDSVTDPVVGAVEA